MPRVEVVPTLPQYATGFPHTPPPPNGLAWSASGVPMSAYDSVPSIQIHNVSVLEISATGGALPASPRHLCVPQPGAKLRDGGGKGEGGVGDIRGTGTPAGAAGATEGAGGAPGVCDLCTVCVCVLV